MPCNYVHSFQCLYRVADEEDGSIYGTKYLIEHHADLVDASVVFTELGGFPIRAFGSVLYPVQIAEKGSCKIKITGRGSGGHSSISHTDNCIGRIGRIASALCKTRLPLRLTPPALSVISFVIRHDGTLRLTVYSKSMS